jgi:hypothetical protein
MWPHKIWNFGRSPIRFYELEPLWMLQDFTARRNPSSPFDSTQSNGSAFDEIRVCRTLWSDPSCLLRLRISLVFSVSYFSPDVVFYTLWRCGHSLFLLMKYAPVACSKKKSPVHIHEMTWCKGWHVTLAHSITNERNLLSPRKNTLLRRMNTNQNSEAGLAAIEKSRARQKCRITWHRKGDANTKFFSDNVRY